MSGDFHRPSVPLGEQCVGHAPMEFVTSARLAIVRAAVVELETGVIAVTRLVS